MKVRVKRSRPIASKEVIVAEIFSRLRRWEILGFFESEDLAIEFCEDLLNDKERLEAAFATKSVIVLAREIQ